MEKELKNISKALRQIENEITTLYKVIENYSLIIKTLLDTIVEDKEKEEQ